jgi:hypothetical protein
MDRATAVRPPKCLLPEELVETKRASDSSVREVSSIIA